jgi:chromosome segregation ATPase
MAEEKETMLSLQIAEYERQKDELAHDIAEAKRQKAAEFEPFARELQKDVDDIVSTIQQQKASIQKMDTEKKDCITNIQELQDNLKGTYVYVRLHATAGWLTDADWLAGWLAG